MLFNIGVNNLGNFVFALELGFFTSVVFIILYKIFLHKNYKNLP